MQVVKIEWDLEDSVDFAENGNVAPPDLPEKVIVPDGMDYSECSDWLSDEYGWCVKSLTIIENDVD